MDKKGFCLILLVLLVISSAGLRNAGSISEMTIENSDLSDIPIEETESYKNGMRPAEEFCYGALRVEDLLYPFEDEMDPLDITPIENINLEVPHYYQNQQSWSNNTMQTCGSTIGKAGCALTSFTMVANYLGSNDNPGQVNTKLGVNGHLKNSIFGHKKTSNFGHEKPAVIQNLSLAITVEELPRRQWSVAERLLGNSHSLSPVKLTCSYCYLSSWLY